MRNIPLLTAALLLLTACGDKETWEPREVQDEGSVCLEAPTGDADGTVLVFFDECFSSSCDRNEVGSCTATLDGTIITVTSTLTWETETGVGECTSDCGMVSAECTVGPLPAGSYTVVHGDESEAFDVPTESECNLW